MAQDTVVQYVLKVDAKGAQRSLDRTGNEAKGAGQAFDRLENSGAKAAKGIKKVGTQSKAATSKARQLRRAGRDLDGAFGDLAQGLSIVNPQLGGALMTISDGASVVEGLGRSMTLFLNPAFAVAATVAIGAGLALFEFQREAEAAQKREEELAEITERTNKTIEEQTRAAQGAAESLASYYQEVDQARINLQLLTGEITQFEVDQKTASAAAEKFGENAKAAQQKQTTALQETIRARREQIRLLQSEIRLLKEQRAIAQPLSARIAGQPQQFEEATGKEKGLQKRLDALTKAQKVDKGRLKDSQAQTSEIRAQQRVYEDILLQQAKIAEDERQRAEAERRRAAAARARSTRLRQEAAEKRKIERQQKQVQKAQEQIEKILETAKYNQLDAVGQINAKYEKQKQKLLELAETSGDIETANAAIVELTKVRNQLLDKERAKQDAIAAKEAERIKKESERIRKEGEKRTKEAQRLKSETDLIVKSINTLANVTSDLFIRPTGQLEAMLQKVERIKNKFDQIKESGFKGFAEEGITSAFQKLGDAEGLQKGLSSAIEKLNVVASLDAASIVSLVSPIAGAFTSIVQGLGERVLDPEQGPEEIRRQALAQAEAIKAGIAFLPELLLSIAPQLGFAIAEAFVDGVQLLFRNLIQVIKDTFLSAFSFRDRDPDGNSGSQRFFESLARFFDPDQSASFMSGGRFIPKAQGGIRFTGMQDGLAMLHRGEFVVPQSGQRPQQVDRQLNGATGGGMTVNINSAVVDRNAVDALVRQIEIRFNNQFGTSSSNLFGGR